MSGQKLLKFSLTLILISACVLEQTAQARELEYESGEIDIRVSPGEPTQLQFPGKIAGGYKKKLSTLAIDKKDGDLVIFANEGISDSGEAILVRLEDGRSYSVRARRATPDAPRDDIIKINDERSGLVQAASEEEPAYKEQKFDYAPPSKVSGLMREMVLMAEFGKANVPGYRVSERYKGDVLLNDGTMVATVDRILIGPNLWGYVIETQNLLDQSQRINPATFRIDGTRAISAERWELAPRPLNVEEQISSADRGKIYVVTRAKR